MVKIKKIDIYILKQFLGYFFMTFFICILILLMQFTWKHLTELIGNPRVASQQGFQDNWRARDAGSEESP